jgi:hypothetical protein
MPQVSFQVVSELLESFCRSLVLSRISNHAPASIQGRLMASLKVGELVDHQAATMGPVMR